MADNARRRRSHPTDINQFLSQLHPVVRRAFLASGGEAYRGSPQGGRGNPADMFNNAKTASDQAFGGVNPNQGEGGYAGDLNMTRRGDKGMMAQARALPAQRQLERFAQPIDAGAMRDGSRAQILGPKLVRMMSPNGGSATFSVRDAHDYLTKHPGGFTPNEQYLAQRQTGIEAGMGMTKETPVVHPGAGGDYLSRGGVETPVENLSSADRMQHEAYNPGVIGSVGRMADTLTASPAANVVGRVAGQAVDKLAGMGRSIANAFAGAPAAQNYGQNVSDGSAGASRRQAARIETPTGANPVPVSDTSPEPPIPLENPPLNEDERFAYGR